MFDLVTPENLTNLLQQGRTLDELTGGSVSNAIRTFGAKYTSEWLAKRQGRLVNETKEKVESLGGVREDGVDISLLEPTLQSALYEGRDELTGLWSTLIARIMSEGKHGIRASFIETLKQLDPEDALLLQHYASDEHRAATAERTSDDNYLGTPSRSEESLEIRRFSVAGLSKDDLDISKDHLVELKCLTLTERRRATLTPYGRALLAAVTMPTEIG